MTLSIQTDRHDELSRGSREYTHKDICIRLFIINGFYLGVLQQIVSHSSSSTIFALSETSKHIVTRYEWHAWLNNKVIILNKTFSYSLSFKTECTLQVGVHNIAVNSILTEVLFIVLELSKQLH